MPVLMLVPNDTVSQLTVTGDFAGVCSVIIFLTLIDTALVNDVLQGAASALKAVCEVSIEEQDVVPRRSVNYILNVLTPRFIKNFKEASPQIRYDVVRMYNNQGTKVFSQRQKLHRLICISCLQEKISCLYWATHFHYVGVILKGK